MAKNRIFGLFLLIYFLSLFYVIVLSDSGLLERTGLKRQYNDVTARIERLKSENNRLRVEFKKYNEGQFSERDLMEAGFVRNKRKIVVMEESFQHTQSETAEASDTSSSVPLKHLKLIWVVFSGLVILFYFTRYAQRSEV